MAPDSHELHPLTIVNFSPQDEQGEVNVLMEDDLGRQLSIPVGACGAQAIMLALRRVRIDRPLTHELLLTLAEYLDARVDRLVIDDLSKNVYYARLVLETATGPISLDCRPSDGLAVVLRADAPFFATDSVMEGESVEE
jgi:bifunctional DNase/RNase